MRLIIKKLPVLLVMVIAVAILSCNGNKQEKRTIDRKKLEESLINANKNLVKDEAKAIDEYISRNNLDMQETGSGLRYVIYKKGNGPSVKKGDVVKLDYIMMLMNGDTVETSAEKGYLTFAAGRGDAIPGLHEAVLMMNEGDSAKLVVPSHLAYGLTGIPQKIPKKAVLIYDINLEKVNK